MADYGGEGGSTPRSRPPRPVQTVVRPINTFSGQPPTPPYVPPVAPSPPPYWGLNTPAPSGPIGGYNPAPTYLPVDNPGNYPWPPGTTLVPPGGVAQQPAFNPPFNPPAGGGGGYNVPAPAAPPGPSDSGGGTGGAPGPLPPAPALPLPVPALPPEPPYISPLSRTDPYLMVSDEGLRWLDEVQRRELDEWLTRMGYRATGEIGQYGPRSYVRPMGPEMPWLFDWMPPPGGSATGGGPPMPGTGGVPGGGMSSVPVPMWFNQTDFASIQDTTVRNWVNWLIGELGYAPRTGYPGLLPAVPQPPAPTPSPAPTPPPDQGRRRG